MFRCFLSYSSSARFFRSNNRFENQIRNFRRGRSSGNEEKSLIRTTIRPSPFEKIPFNEGSVESRQLWKAAIFTAAFGTGSFIGAAIWEYEGVRARAVRAARAPFSWAMQTKKRAADWRDEVKLWWDKLSPGEKVFAPICAANILVFVVWRVPRLQPAMMKYFCSNPAAKAVCWPSFLSTFSHYSMFHIFANMYVLHSFSSVAVMALGKEQFLGLYLSAGVIASLASYLYKASIRQAGLSLGASGAIMAVLAYVCTEYPDTQLNIIFLPALTFSAGMAIKCIIGLDVAGLILGWKVFDHAAHFGGALFGVFWSYYGSRYLWPKRELLQREYHKLRSNK